MFRRFIWNHRIDYEVAERSTKRDVANVVIKTIANQSPPGRFLEKDETGHFILVSDNKRIFEKTCQALRGKKLKKPRLDKHFNEAPAGVRRNGPRKAKKLLTFTLALERKVKATSKTAKSNEPKRVAPKNKNKNKKTCTSPQEVMTIARDTRSRARSLSGVIPPEIQMEPLLEVEPLLYEQDHDSMQHDDIEIDIHIPDVIYPSVVLAIDDIGNDDLLELQLMRTRDLLDEPRNFDSNVSMLPPALTVFYSKVFAPSKRRENQESPPTVVSHSDIGSDQGSDV